MCYVMGRNEGVLFVARMMMYCTAFYHTRRAACGLMMWILRDRTRRRGVSTRPNVCSDKTFFSEDECIIDFQRIRFPRVQFEVRSCNSIFFDLSKGL